VNFLNDEKINLNLSATCKLKVIKKYMYNLNVQINFYSLLLFFTAQSPTSEWIGTAYNENIFTRIQYVLIAAF